MAHFSRPSLIRFIINLVCLVCLICAQGAGEEKLVLLRYDDGVPDDGLWMDDARGHAVVFTAPCEGWTLSKIAVCGRLNPEVDQGLFILEIWDEDLNLLYSRADVPKSYFDDAMDWAEMDIPEISVSGNFYVCLFEFSNIYLGMNLGDPSSLRSLVVSRNPNRIDRWNLQHPANQTDWMISVLGCSPAPEVDLAAESKDNGVIIKAAIVDEDANLASATIYVIEKDEVVWSERQQVEGAAANLTFMWPLQEFRITNGTDAVELVFVENTVGISGDEAPYIAYSAPCLLKLTPDMPNITAYAYFGQDGEFHALMDLYGFPHYRSQEVMKVIRPEVSYGRYRNNNITIREGKTSLSFFRLKTDVGMVAQPPFVLTRSPVHHYRLRLEKVEAGHGEYGIEVVVEDRAGNLVKGSVEGILV